jgi:flagellar motor switch protein FliN
MGCINIEVSKKFSNIMTAAMLDIDEDEVEGEDDVKDVIREMCNIVGGNLKSAFCDVGLICELSPPSFTTGDDFKIESLNTVRHERYVFSYKEHIVIVEVGIRVGEAVEEDDASVEQIIELKPVDVKLVEDFDIKTPINDQTIEVFDMMLSMELEASEDDLKSSLDGDRLVGAVSFVGSLMGNFSIHVSREFSHQMTAAMLGIELEEVEGENDVKDVISELCNIVGGNLKSKFCDSGMTCELSTPTLTTGSNFKIEAKDMVRYDRFSFLHGDIPVVVEVVLKVADQDGVEDIIDPAAESDSISQGDIDVLLAEEALNETAETVIEENLPETEYPAEDLDGLDPLNDDEKINFILDIPLDIVVELGRNKMKINELYKIGPGSVVEFANLAGEPLDILVNGTLIAKGEVMVQGEKYGIRIVDILSRMERIQSMM